MLEWKDLRVLVMVPLQKRNSESKVLLLKEQTDLEEPGQAWKLGASHRPALHLFWDIKRPLESSGPMP